MSSCTQSPHAATERLAGFPYAHVKELHKQLPKHPDIPRRSNVVEDITCALNTGSRRRIPVPPQLSVKATANLSFSEKVARKQCQLLKHSHASNVLSSPSAHSARALSASDPDTNPDSRMNLRADEPPKPSDPSSTVTQSVSTLDFDTVFALPAADVNAAIAGKKSYPSNLATETVLFDGQKPSKLRAAFGAWRIRAGGDGKNLRMTVPMANIEVTFGATGAQLAIPDCDLGIEIRLHFLPHDPESNEEKPKSGSLIKLVAQDKPKPDLPDHPVVHIVGSPNYKSTPDAEIPSIMVQESFEVMWHRWIESNLATLTHIFAVININQDLAKDPQWAWTKPSYVAYAYVDSGLNADDPKALEKAQFGVLCKTGGRNGDGLQEQLDVNAIPAGSRGGYLIARNRFVQDMLLPSLTTAMKGMQRSDVTVSSDSERIQLADGRSGNVTLHDVEHDGKKYSPKVYDFQLQLLGSIVKLYTKTRTTISSGIYSWCSCTHWYNIKLISQKNGKQTVGWEEVQPKSEQHWTEKEEWVKILQTLATVVVAVAAIVIVVVTDGLAAVLAGALVAAMGTTLSKVPNILSIIGEDEAPSIDLLTLNMTNAIRWPLTNTFRLTSAALHNTLQLGGAPNLV